MSHFFVFFTLFFTSSIFAHSNDDDRLWRATVIPPIDHPTYRSLHACVANNKQQHHLIASCFTNAMKPRSQLKSLLSAGKPPLLFVPDCLESVLESITDSTPLFTATIPMTTTTATTTSRIQNFTLLRSTIRHSVSTIEVAHPPRRIPGGGYSMLANALLKIGYIDGESMRAVAWDWRLPTAHTDAINQISALLDDTNTIIVARGAGCALAAQAALSNKIRALLCLSEPTDGILPAGLHANELGLVVRRRGRPVPIVSGPWGDGEGPRRCEVHKNIQAVNVPSSSSIKVLCADDCRRWIKGSRLEECESEGVMTNQLNCLVNALIASA